MKTNYTTLIITCLVVFLCACKKSNSETIPGAIIAKWNIVSDSTYTGVGANNVPLNYKGQAGDYFDIRANGFIYTKEDTVLDTLSYSLKSGNQITIQSFGATLNNVPAVSNITNLTAHSAIISSPVLYSPGGVFGRKITLTR
jgi:hypothetical protein